MGMMAATGNMGNMGGRSFLPSLSISLFSFNHLTLSMLGGLLGPLPGMSGGGGGGGGGMGFPNMLNPVLAQQGSGQTYPLFFFLSFLYLPLLPKII